DLIAAVPRIEERRVHAAWPMHEALTDPPALQLAQQRHRADQRVLGAGVEPAHQLVAPLERDRQSRAQVLGIARVEAGREAEAFSAQPTNRPEAERPLRCDVQRIWFERPDPRNGA